ncbi:MULTISPECIES: nucleoside deaminase [unclassified Rhodococcus (in: high G+C Gram-positive bacteria)]|uniref:nucleoside deaminase n=1 Tax=unclassified Rhodococcus (in: high G+C Gram-positive bacteria) TaxID=192944 RepID=UPI0007BAEF0A|nr:MULTISPECIES: nucleoside deaminase [unclassified Rhodococcus (in: high G+C Gram-positive bacteria)]KZF03089.1 tRNA-specific adenosine deaminase [Rhodococcus sp. EPR-279]KZF09724.1 tRNA-specific adenosine deaminase [Rhodococcus sp. EPR-147]
MSISSSDRAFLARAVDLAAEAARTGNDPFGSILVSDGGQLLAEDRNRVGDRDDPTQHPEIALSRWAATNLDADQRRSSTVYTSGEHCVMCSASHGIVGLGRIVYATSTAQLLTWLEEFGAAPLAITPSPIQQIVPGIAVDGPVAEFSEAVRELHRQRHTSAQ